LTVFNHTGLVVTDLERSKRFYQEVLGFMFWYEIEPPDDLTAKLNCLDPPLGTTASYLFLDEFILELLHYDAEGATELPRRRTMDEPGLTHISVAVDDIREAAVKAVQHGGEVVDDSNIGVALFVRDPDGQLIELLPLGFRDRLPPKP
jgi:lactoylglutathione lyase